MIEPLPRSPDNRNFAQFRGNIIKYMLMMQEMQRCHRQAQEFDNFPAIGSTPKLFGSSPPVEHVAFGGKSSSGETRRRAGYSLIATHCPQLGPD